MTSIGSAPVTIELNVITCAQTSHRLPLTLGSFSSLFAKVCSTPAIICSEHDIGSFDQSVFNSSLWSSHIEEIREILALNIRDTLSRVSNYTDGKIGILTLLDQVTQYFPPRCLKEAEKSLLWKHYAILSRISSCEVKLIIEDDAILRVGAERDLIALAEYAHSQNVIVDLGEYPGLISRGQRRESGLITVQNIACTRTTVAVLLPSSFSTRLAQAYWPCSLPADLHHQLLYKRLKLAGAWVARSPIEHLSISGKVASSIQI